MHCFSRKEEYFALSQWCSKYSGCTNSFQLATGLQRGVKVVAYQLQGPPNRIGDLNSVFVCNGCIINSDERAVQSQHLWLGWQLITISLSVIMWKFVSLM